MIGGALEIGREHPTEKKVIVNVDRHFILKLAEMRRGSDASE